MFDDMYGSVLERELSGEVASLRKQMRALTAERDELAEERQQFVTGLRIAEERATTAEDDATALRARVAEVEAVRDAYCDSLMEAAHFYMEWALKDGNSPGYNIAKARTYGDKANEYRIRAEKAESERDAAQQRVKALEGAVRRVTREALEALEKMPTPTKEHEALAKLQRNLLQRLREETDAAMAAATTNTEAP